MENGTIFNLFGVRAMIVGKTGGGKIIVQSERGVLVELHEVTVDAAMLVDKQKDT
jgi:hypothetical protein